MSPVKTLSLVTSKIKLDDALQPLSSKIIVNSEAEIEFTKAPNKANSTKSQFTESFYNKYYNLATIEAKLKFERAEETNRARND